jgi:putative transposase
MTVEEVAAMEGKTNRTIRRNIKKYGKTREVPSRGRNGKTTQIHVSSLPPELQKKFVVEHGIHAGHSIIPSLSTEAALVATEQALPSNIGFPSGAPENAGGGRHVTSPLPIVSPANNGAPSPPYVLPADILRDDRVGRIARFCEGVMRPPKGITRTAHLKALCLREGISLATGHRWAKTYHEKGHAGLKHRKSNRGEPRSWTPAAIDFWVGLCLKRPHRKLDFAPLYEALCIEAQKQEWIIGSYSSALWWYRKRVVPQFKALQRGGLRALDNLLPPVVRDYSDQPPLSIIVGDQHRFDFWVQDDEVGTVFRPEGYFWQDLRTRCFYGGAVAKKYDAQLMGLALRMGMKVFGPFGSIYTDHGRPEESKYIMGILKEMRALGLEARQTEDIYAELDGVDPEEMHCLVSMPGSHMKAVVRNAKAKMIEGTFRELERIMRNVLKVPGHVKDIKALQEEQEVDHKEIERLAAAGKLLTFREFVLAWLKAMDYYNAKKVHRGVLKEWAWKPRPKQATPMQCLAQCYLAGEWKPVQVSEQLIDMVFLRRTTRVVDRGRIWLNKICYEAPQGEGERELAALTGQRVSVRHEHPLDPSYVLIFNGDTFVCEARPVEPSSMKNKELARRKIAQKRALRRQFLDEYRALTSRVPDFIQYSQVPDAEKAAAIVGRKRRQQALKEAERLRPQTAEELAAKVEEMEQRLLPRRPIFQSEIERYRWILDEQARGNPISEEDAAFVAQQEAGMKPETLKYWDVYKEGIGLIPTTAEREGSS